MNAPSSTRRPLARAVVGPGAYSDRPRRRPRSRARPPRRRAGDVAARLGAVAAFAAGLPLAGCVVMPSTVDTYDPACQAVVHHVVLQPVQIAAINHCSNQGCTMMVVAGAATAAATAIVSGSIAVVGNVAYWVERRASCHAPGAVVPTAPPVVAPSPSSAAVPD